MKFIEYTVKNRLGFITLNRPEKKNALNPEMIDELKEAFTTSAEDSRVKVVILKAHGNVFCAGADLEYLKKLQNFSYEENFEDSNNLKELFLQIYRFKKVVIAQVQGHALAGGCGLTTVCDFTFAIPEAKFGYTEVKIGFIPAIVLVFLLRKIGETKTRHLLLSGNLILADQAQAFGIVSSVFPKATIEHEVEKFALNLVENNSANSMMLTKDMIDDVQSLRLEEALHYATKMNAKARASADCKAGIASFIDKEKLFW